MLLVRGKGFVKSALLEDWLRSRLTVAQEPWISKLRGDGSWRVIVAWL